MVEVYVQGARQAGLDFTIDTSKLDFDFSRIDFSGIGTMPAQVLPRQTQVYEYYPTKDFSENPAFTDAQLGAMLFVTGDGRLARMKVMQRFGLQDWVIDNTITEGVDDANVPLAALVDSARVIAQREGSGLAVIHPGYDGQNFAQINPGVIEGAGLDVSYAQGRALVTVGLPIDRIPRKRPGKILSIFPGEDRGFNFSDLIGKKR